MTLAVNLTGRIVYLLLGRENSGEAETAVPGLLKESINQMNEIGLASISRICSTKAKV